MERAQCPPDLGQPRRARRDPVRAGDLVAAAAEHRLRRRGAVPVRRPPGGGACAARRAAAGQLRHLLPRRPGSLPGAGRGRRRRRRAGGRPGGQPPRDAGHHRAAVRDDPPALQRAGRAVCRRRVRRGRRNDLRRPPGHQRRPGALPARAGFLDRGQNRVLALARLPAGRAGRCAGGRDRLLGAALPAHGRAPRGPGGTSVPGPSGAGPGPGAVGGHGGTARRRGHRGGQAVRNGRGRGDGGAHPRRLSGAADPRRGREMGRAHPGAGGARRRRLRPPGQDRVQRARRAAGQPPPPDRARHRAGRHGAADARRPAAPEHRRVAGHARRVRAVLCRAHGRPRAGQAGGRPFPARADRHRGLGGGPRTRAQPEQPAVRQLAGLLGAGRRAHPLSPAGRPLPRRERQRGDLLPDRPPGRAARPVHLHLLHLLPDPARPDPHRNARLPGRAAGRVLPGGHLRQHGHPGAGQVARGDAGIRSALPAAPARFRRTPATSAPPVTSGSGTDPVPQRLRCRRAARFRCAARGEDGMRCQISYLPDPYEVWYRIL